MTLRVRTARITYGGADRLDITRKGKDPVGLVFAPSGKLLGWGLNMRKQANRRREEALLARNDGAQKLRLEDVERFESWAWTAYEARYEEAMRVSRKNHAPVWRELLGRERVVLVCFCNHDTRCHRHVLARLLAAQGAINLGELAAEDQRPRRVAHRPVSGTLFGGDS